MAVDDADIVMTGPNLRLDDLRWLVARCEGFAGDSAVDLIARRGRAPLPVDYEQIVVHPRLRAATRAAGEHPAG